MAGFESELHQRLDRLRDSNLHRRLRPVGSPQGARVWIEGSEKINFSSNDYLGLASHPALKEAAVRAIERFGTGSGASRLVCGSLELHHELERTLASFKGVEAALVFSTGYAAAVGAIPALVQRGDILILDKRVHASIVDAGRLSGATLRIFAHNSLENLERLLQWTAKQRESSPEAKVLIVTESLFSMDGDAAPLAGIVALKEQYNAWLMVDEAHAVGIFGQNRRGLIEELGLEGRVEVQMGTLGKAVGAAGGYIAGPRVITDYLVNKARSFIFSTAPPPAVSAAAIAGIRLISSPEGAILRERLRANIAHFAELTRRCTAIAHSPIHPWIVGSEEAALLAAERLLNSGVLVPAIRYPTVARGQARLRITFSAAHASEEIAQLVSVLAQS